MTPKTFAENRETWHRLLSKPKSRPKSAQIARVEEEEEEIEQEFWKVDEDEFDDKFVDLADKICAIRERRGIANRKGRDFAPRNANKWNNLKAKFQGGARPQGGGRQFEPRKGNKDGGRKPFVPFDEMPCDFCEKDFPGKFAKL